MASPKRLRVPVSTARAKLFSLADMVRSGDDTTVVLEQRGAREQVALVRESRLAYLEARVMELEAKEKQAPFKLAGSLSTVLDDEALEAVLKKIRKEWTPADVPVTASQRSARRRP